MRVKQQKFINNIDIDGEMKKCEICGRLGSFESTDNICSFCGGTKESTSASKGFIEHHICGCNTTDRRNCPWCKKPCHHDASLNPRILISPM